MCICLLKVPLEGASPETKFFLIALLKHFDIDSLIAAPVSSLTKKLGVTSNVVSKATRYLVEQEWLIREKVPTPTGRPGYQYLFSSKLKTLLTDNKIKGRMVNGEQINQTLFTPFELKGQQKIKLTLSNRLLFAVMLSFADEYGQLDQLSKSDLSRYTGITSVGLRTQIQKLMRLRLILNYVAGIKHRNIFGVSKSIYRLATDNFLYEKQKKSKTECLINFDTLGLVRALCLSVEGIQPAVIASLKARRIRGLLQKGMSDSVVKLLAMKVNGYASNILTEHFRSSSHYNPVIKPAFHLSVRDKIKNDLQGNPVIRGLPSVIHELVLYTASTVLQRLGPERLNFHDPILQVIIYQQASPAGDLVVEFFSKPGEVQGC